jgi:hypothetical protein
MGTDVYAQSMATAMRGVAKVHSSRRLMYGFIKLEFGTVVFIYGLAQYSFQSILDYEFLDHKT